MHVKMQQIIGADLQITPKISSVHGKEPTFVWTLTYEKESPVETYTHHVCSLVQKIIPMFGYK